MFESPSMRILIHDTHRCIIVEDDRYMVTGSHLRGRGTGRRGVRSFVTFLRELMFRLFAFTFIWLSFVAIVFGEIKELIFEQFTLSLLSDHFDTVSRSNLLPPRELVERTSCQQIRSWGIYNCLRLSLGAHVTHC